MMMIITIAIFGGLGAMSRFVADGVLRTVVGRRFPWATIIINIAGSLLLGYVTGLLVARHMPSATKLFIGTGFCGGFTTFSTASFEAVRLIEARRYGACAAQVLLTLSLCLLAATLGFAWAS